MTFLDFFSGIGGFRIGMEQAGHTCVGFCEFNKYAYMSYVSMHCITETQREKLAAMPLKQRQKEIMKDEYRNGEWYENDIRNVNANTMPRADIWCFGAPCQDFSGAGLRAGLDGDRSSLVREIFRLVKETDEDNRPGWLIYENVKGMLSSNGGWDFAAILCEMDELGYDCEWQIVNSKDYVPQNRERVFVIGHMRGRSSSEIFPLEGTNGTNRVDVIAHNKTFRRNLQTYSLNGITETLDTAQGGGRGHYVGINYIGKVRNHDTHGDDNTNSVALCPDSIAGTLAAQQYKDPLRIAIPVSTNISLIGHEQRPSGNMSQRTNIYAIEGKAPTLMASQYKEPVMVGVKYEVDGAIPVLTPDRSNKRQMGRRFKELGDPAFTLTSIDRHGVALTEKSEEEKREENEGEFVEMPGNVTAYATWYPKGNCYVVIRKLTPKETFRLQGFSDEYYERAEFVNSNSQLYKQSGNSVTVPVIKAIGERIR